MKATLLFGLVLALSVPLSGAEPSPVAVDLTPALRVGKFTTSRYLFEKAWNQFVGSAARRNGQRPGADETAKWFRLYLAQQLIKADLVAQGQLAHPQVVDITERMARRILIQPGGLLERALVVGDPLVFRRARRARLLDESRFAPRPEVIAMLWRAIAPALSRGDPLRDHDVAGIASAVVATYFYREAPRQITAADFVRDFQQGVARLAPRDAAGLKEQVEDIVLAEYDLAEARQLGLDRTPQFLEDRLGFARIQALVVHEQEVLAPRLSLTAGELQAYYDANRERYASPVEVKGTLFVFTDRARAAQSLAPSAATPNEADHVIDPFVLRRDAPSPFAGTPYLFLASAPSGRKYGPFGFGDRHAVFLKQGVGESRAVPFQEVEPILRRQLQREKLDAWELELFAREATRLQLLLDPRAYGLPAIVPAAVAATP